jgi:hypothetical protein
MVQSPSNVPSVTELGQASLAFGLADFPVASRGRLQACPVERDRYLTINYYILEVYHDIR